MELQPQRTVTDSQEIKLTADRPFSLRETLRERLRSVLDP